MKNQNKRAYAAIAIGVVIFGLLIFTGFKYVNTKSEEIIVTDENETKSVIIEQEDQIPHNPSCETAQSEEQIITLSNPIASPAPDYIEPVHIDTTSKTTNPEELYPKIAYLTFDDGPSELTPQILEILAQHGIKATFFVVYSEYGDENEIYKRIVEEGHSIGNHTYTHILPRQGWGRFFDDLEKMEDFLYKETGVRPSIIRFPGGSRVTWAKDDDYIENVEKLHSMGYQYHDWNISTSDGGKGIVTARDILDNVYLRSYYCETPVINVLMHDRSNKFTTVEALDDVIKLLKDEGYVFLPILPDTTPIHIFDMDDEYLEE